jgi:large subunit ribosomal protein L29
MARAKEYRDMSSEELEAALTDINRELFELRNEFMAAKKSEKPHRLRERRRDKARLLTVMTEKQTMNKQALR